MRSLRHVLSAHQFDRPLIEWLFNRADEIAEQFFLNNGGRQMMHERFAGRLVFALFFEPSTRTRFSFSSAAIHFGMQVVATENAREFSSAIKGGSLEDEIRSLCRFFPDAIVLRHHQTGGAERAAVVSSVPIINAGDGKGEHPTQALLDLYTIKRERGKIDGCTVAIVGDLAHGRTARSLALLLTQFERVKVIFVSPPELAIGDDIKRHLGDAGVRFGEQESLLVALPEADVIYMTRTQWERIDWRIRLRRLLRRISEVLRLRPVYRYAIGAAEREAMKPDAILMHPLPRNHEVPVAVDADPRAVYFNQVRHGMFLRMALLEWVLDGA